MERKLNPLASVRCRYLSGGTLNDVAAGFVWAEPAPGDTLPRGIPSIMPAKTARMNQWNTNSFFMPDATLLTLSTESSVRRLGIPVAQAHVDTSVRTHKFLEFVDIGVAVMIGIDQAGFKGPHRPGGLLHGHSVGQIHAH